MMGRFRDAVQTLFQPSWDARLHRLEAEARAQTAEARAIIAELESALEKLSTRLAREAKRRSRDVHAVLEPGGNGDVEADAAVQAALRRQNGGPVVTEALDQQNWKAQMRARHRGMMPGPTFPERGQ